MTLSTLKAEALAQVDQLRRERDEARAALVSETRVSLDFQKQRDEARAARDHFKEQLRERAEALLDARAEVERLRADKDRLHGVLRDIEYDKDKVAERQREACAAAVDAHGIRSEWGTVVRATPLVTEGEP